MDVALYAISLGLLLCGYWWALKKLAPRAMRSGLLAGLALWTGAGVAAVFVAGLPTGFVDEANWAFLVGLILWAAITAWTILTSARNVGRARRSHHEQPG
jgi:hypothetical protein